MSIMIWKALKIIDLKALKPAITTKKARYYTK
jgi:hypothetical protein